MIDGITLQNPTVIQYFQQLDRPEIDKDHYDSILAERSWLPNPVVRITARQGLNGMTGEINFNKEDSEILSSAQSCLVGYLYEEIEGGLNQEWAIVLNRPVDSTEDIYLTFLRLYDEPTTKNNFTQKRYGSKSTVMHTLYPSPVDDDATQDLYMQDCEARFVEWRSYHKSLQGSDFLARLLYAISHYYKDTERGYHTLGYDFNTLLESFDCVISNAARNILGRTQVITWAFSPNYFISHEMRVSKSIGYDSSALMTGKWKNMKEPELDPRRPKMKLRPVGGDTQVGGESINVSSSIPPIHLDKRLPIRMRHNKATGDYWINQVRCTVCGQRVIVSLNERDVPPPTLNLKCPECKKKGLLIE